MQGHTSVHLYGYSVCHDPPAASHSMWQNVAWELHAGALKPHCEECHFPFLR